MVGASGGGSLPVDAAVAPATVDPPAADGGGTNCGTTAVVGEGV